MTAVEMAQAEIQWFEDWRKYQDSRATRHPDVTEADWYFWTERGVGPYARTAELMMARWIVEQAAA